MSHVVRVRRARKRRPGCGGYCPAIQPGDLYVEWTGFPGPGDDAGYATAAGHPVRMAECRTCAERYGRGHLLDAYERDEKPPGGLQCGGCGQFCSRRTATPVKYWPDTWIDHYICQTCNTKEAQTA